MRVATTGNASRGSHMISEVRSQETSNFEQHTWFGKRRRKFRQNGGPMRGAVPQISSFFTTKHIETAGQKS